MLKGKLGEFRVYFRKILLHQQKFLVVSVLSYLPWLPRNLKKCPKWNYYKLFSVGNTFSRYFLQQRYKHRIFCICCAM